MLYSYKMTHDYGFAPNPFFGILSLATCKPIMREKKLIGTYVAGFTSKKLCNEEVGMERLVYIMKITGKLNFEQYYTDKRFECKIPSNLSRITKMGDNIYTLNEDKYEQVFNYFHNNKEDKKNDLKSDQVLLSNEFFYWGAAAIPIDEFKIRIPKTQSAHGVKTSDESEIARLWKYLETNFEKNILIHSPHVWNENEPFNT